MCKIFGPKIWSCKIWQISSLRPNEQIHFLWSEACSVSVWEWDDVNSGATNLEQVHITTRCRVSLVARLERQIYWATKVFIPDTNRISITNTFKLVINKRTRGQSCLWRQAEDRWHSWGTSLVCLFLGRTRSLWACSIMKATMLALIWCWARSTSWLSFLGKRRCVENMV